MRTIKAVKDRGIEELQSFKNRLARSYGMDRVSKEDFEKANEKITELIELVENMNEEDE